MARRNVGSELDEAYGDDNAELQKLIAQISETHERDVRRDLKKQGRRRRSKAGDQSRGPAPFGKSGGTHDPSDDDSDGAARRRLGWVARVCLTLRSPAKLPRCCCGNWAALVFLLVLIILLNFYSEEARYASKVKAQVAGSGGGIAAAGLFSDGSGGGGVFLVEHPGCFTIPLSSRTFSAIPLPSSAHRGLVSRV